MRVHTLPSDAPAPILPASAASVVTVDVLAGWLRLAPAMEAEPVPAVPAYVQADAPAPRRLVLLDIRYELGSGATDHEGYLHGHLPGAVYVALPSRLAGPPGTLEGRHPLPDPADFAETVRMWGIDDGDTVVVYDDIGGLAAARAWWLLRHGGLPDVLLLDGGLDAWREAGLPLQSGEVIPTPGSATIQWGRMPVVDAAGAEEIAEHGLLLDARAAERYRGEVEPLDPVAGHIPGARSLPTAQNLRPDGRLLPPEQLAARFAAAGVRDDVRVAVYCGSGVTAAHQVLAMTVAGHPGAALFPGSWSSWVHDLARPVAVGASPDGH